MLGPTPQDEEPFTHIIYQLLPELLWNNGQEIVEARRTTTLARQHIQPMEYQSRLGRSLRGLWACFVQAELRENTTHTSVYSMVWSQFLGPCSLKHPANHSHGTHISGALAVRTAWCNPVGWESNLSTNHIGCFDYSPTITRFCGIWPNSQLLPHHPILRHRIQPASTPAFTGMLFHCSLIKLVGPHSPGKPLDGRKQGLKWKQEASSKDCR